VRGLHEGAERSPCEDIAGPGEDVAGPGEDVAGLQRSAWPGNVRELRNYVEQYLVFRVPPPVSEKVSTNVPPPVDVRVPYTEARDRILADFERRYFEALLRAHDGKVPRAAAAAGLDRRYFSRLLHRLGLGPERDPQG
jgi:two-component system, NtrC family, response regulator GlrR